MITRADIRIIANSFIRDMMIRYVYCSLCNFATTKHQADDPHDQFPRGLDITTLEIPFVLSPVRLLVIRDLTEAHRITPEIERGSKRVRSRRNTVETATMTYRACQDSEQGIGGGGSVWWSRIERWGKLAKIPRK